MGYETTLFICEPAIKVDGKRGMRWADVIATFDLCKVGDPGENGLAPAKKPLFYVYLEGARNRTYRDLYGHPLSVGTPRSVADALEKKHESDDYRRFAPCIALLRSFSEKDFPNLIVLGYGH